MHEQRYRRQFLNSDTRQNVVAAIIVCLAYMISTANDFRILSGSWLLPVALAGRVVTLMVTILATVLMLRARWPRQHDRAFTLWVVGIGVINSVIHLTRIPAGIYTGVLFSACILIGLLYFAMQGPLWPRHLTAGLYIGSTLVLLWRPTVALGTVLKQSTVVGMVSWAILGILAERATDALRRKQFRTERHERRLRHELSLKLRELAVEKERAEEVARVRTAFLAVMSHEFRTPMNAVIGLSDLLLDRQLAPEDQAQVQIISDSARALLTIINDILDFTKIDTQKLSLSLVPLELPKLAASVVDMLRPTAASRAITLTLELDPALPASLLGDDVRLRQVLVNLVANAIKFTERGMVRLKLTACAAGATDHDITVRVEDTGIGIAPEALPRLFRPFQQADAGTTRRYGGTGLGLSISRQIVLAMGGDITVDSAPGRGSVFSFTLRLPVAAPRTVPALRFLGSALVPLLPLHILVVDDQPVNREVAKAKLSRLGHHVTLAGDGPEALAAVAQHAYDVIFMDLQMPGLSGIEVTRRIVTQLAGQRLPHIVALTASVFEEDREACRKAGMRDFIGKPIENAQLEAVLHAVAAERGASAPSTGPSENLAPAAWAALRQIEQQGEPDFVARVVQLFLSDTHKRLPRMLDALVRGDVATLEHEAHALRSASATVGATAMATLCEHIERVTRSGHLLQVDAWMAALTLQLPEVERALACELAGPDGAQTP